MRNASAAQLSRLERTLTDNDLHGGHYERLWAILEAARIDERTPGDGTPFPPAQASATIDWVGAQGYYPKPAAGQQTPYPKVPAGHYATTSRTGNQSYDFWKVEVPEAGKWAGFSFPTRVIGGRPEQKVRGAEARAALEAIEAEGVETCRERYARELQQCWKCNIHLTDDLSRELLIGPDCCKIVFGMTQAQRRAALAVAA